MTRAEEQHLRDFSKRVDMRSKGRDKEVLLHHSRGRDVGDIAVRIGIRVSKVVEILKKHKLI